MPPLHPLGKSDPDAFLCTRPFRPEEQRRRPRSCPIGPDLPDSSYFCRLTPPPAPPPRFREGVGGEVGAAASFRCVRAAGFLRGEKFKFCSRCLETPFRRAGWPGSWPQGPRTGGRGGHVAKRPCVLAGGVARWPTGPLWMPEVGISRAATPCLAKTLFQSHNPLLLMILSSRITLPTVSSSWQSGKPLAPGKPHRCIVAIVACKVCNDATVCNGLQRSATICNGLQRSATVCNDLQSLQRGYVQNVQRCNEMQSAAQSAKIKKN